MKPGFTIFLLLIATMTVCAQDGNTEVYRASETVRVAGTNEKHEATIVIRTGEFNQRQHRIERIAMDGTKADPAAKGDFMMLIDGRRPLGVSGDVPASEIRSMAIILDGTKLEVPAKFYSDCYNPNFSSEFWATRLSDNGQSLLVFMAGGKGKALYQVIWILRRDKQHARFFSNCPDCRYADILKFLKEK